jgi:hypothetical protein
MIVNQSRKGIADRKADISSYTTEIAPIIITIITILIAATMVFTLTTVLKPKPQILVWSKFENGNISRGYIQLNDEINITFHVSNIPMRYTIIYKSGEKIIRFLENQTNTTDYSLTLKLNETGFLYISVTCPNCEIESRNIEIVPPSQIELINACRGAWKELELWRIERKGAWKENIITSVIGGVVSGVLVLIISKYSGPISRFLKRMFNKQTRK